MNKLQQLEAKIQEAVPEIMKLKFGCRVDAKDRRGHIHSAMWDKKFNEKNLSSFNFTHEEELRMETVFVDVKKGDNYKILGRPITLEDVLKARDLQAKQEDEKYGSHSRISTYIQGEIRDIVVNWKLNTPLNEQSEETIDFLHTLLTKE